MTDERVDGSVLLIEADAVERELFGSALDAAGFDVVTCPGPTEPDYECVGARTGTCPLLAGAEVVVLDMSLDSEALMTGTTAEELLALYLAAGRPVVALGSHDRPAIDGQLTRIRRHADEGEIVAAVSQLHPATRAASASRRPRRST